MLPRSSLEVVGVEIAELQDDPDGTACGLDPLPTAMGAAIDLVAAG